MVDNAGTASNRSKGSRLRGRILFFFDGMRGCGYQREQRRPLSALCRAVAGRQLDGQDCPQSARSCKHDAGGCLLSLCDVLHSGGHERYQQRPNPCERELERIKLVARVGKDVGKDSIRSEWSEAI